jgi:kinase-associated protein B
MHERERKMQVHESKFNPGDRVIAAYKSGEYIGEIVELRPSKAAVQVLAVLKHPDQGDLHHPMEADVSMFHQRRALSHREVALVPMNSLRRYDGPIPEYRESLLTAIERDIQTLEKTKKWIERSLRELDALYSDYQREGR